VIYSTNITPDPNTGIGAWSEQQFERALREGIAADGTHLYPAFPYTAYTKVTDQDIHAIYAYLRTLKPVNYVPPENKMPFPFSIRALVTGWNVSFFDRGRYAPNASRSAEWNRGCLSHPGSRSLRCLSYAAEFFGRRAQFRSADWRRLPWRNHRRSRGQ